MQGLRDRLTGLLADWGSELAVVLKELEEKRTRVAELEGNVAGRHNQLETLQQRIDGQNTLIEALRGDAEEASKLRVEVRSRDLELERVNSELESWPAERAFKLAGEIFNTMLRVYEIAKEERIPTYIAADRLAEKRVAMVAKLKRTWV